MREITAHKVEGDTAPQIKIEATDEPGAGGANHRYIVSGMQLTENPSFPTEYGDMPSILQVILFQNGPLKETVPNGLTIEALLAIAADRLESLQNGPFPSQHNATALSNVNSAIRALHQRTLKRIANGTEGQSVA